MQVNERATKFNKTPLPASGVGMFLVWGGCSEIRAGSANFFFEFFYVFEWFLGSKNRLKYTLILIFYVIWQYLNFSEEFIKFPDFPLDFLDQWNSLTLPLDFSRPRKFPDLSRFHWLSLTGIHPGCKQICIHSENHICYSKNIL